MRTKSYCLFWVGWILITAPSSAQSTDGTNSIVRVEVPECLPNREFAPVTLQLDSDDEISAVRLYFRRLNPVGGFYFMEMNRVGNAIYSIVFPSPADRAQPPLDDDWWSEINRRDWLESRDRDWLETWLKDQSHEAAEYFFAAFDIEGERVVQSDTQIIAVLDAQDCQVELTPREKEWTEGIAIGETMEAQENLPPFHWTCDGIRDRISIDGRVRPDRTCAIGDRNG